MTHEHERPLSGANEALFTYEARRKRREDESPLSGANEAMRPNVSLYRKISVELITEMFA